MNRGGKFGYVARWSLVLALAIGTTGVWSVAQAADAATRAPATVTAPRAVTGNVTEHAMTTTAMVAQPNQASQTMSTLDAIQQRGVLRVGMTGDYKPMAYFNKETGTYEGIEVDLAKSLAEALGVKLEIVKTTWPTLLQDTLDGKFDVAMSGITRTYAREKVAYMSDGYITFGKTVLMRKQDVSKYPTLDAINKSTVRVGVNPGGTNEKFAHAYLPKATLVVHAKNAEIPELVANGTVDIMVTETLEAARYIREDANLAAPLLDKPFTKNQFGILMKRDEPLLHFVNLWLAQQQLEGKVEAILNAHMKTE